MIAEITKGIAALKKKPKVYTLDELIDILSDPDSGKSLKDDSEGFRSYRIGRLRNIYGRSSKSIIDIVASGPRKTIYAETYRIIRKESR